MKATLNFIAFFSFVQGLFVLICSAAVPEYNQILPSLTLGVTQSPVVLLFKLSSQFVLFHIFCQL